MNAIQSTATTLNDDGTPIEIRAVLEDDGTVGYREAWFDSEFSKRKHLLDDFGGSWRVDLVAHDLGRPLTVEEARSYLAEAGKVIDVAGRMNGETPRFTYDPVLLAEYDTARAAAAATPCSFASCTGVGHEPNMLEAEWSHDADREFDEGLTVVVTRDSTGHHSSFIEARFQGDMTPAELREMAAEYIKLPDWLNALADEIDGMNGAR